MMYHPPDVGPKVKVLYMAETREAPRACRADPRISQPTCPGVHSYCWVLSPLHNVISHS